MTTEAKPSDLDCTDLVLSHFTLSRYHDIGQRIDAAAAAGCRGIGMYIRDFQRLEADGSVAQLCQLLDERGLCVAEIDALRLTDEDSLNGSHDGAGLAAAAFRIAKQFECRSLHVLGPYAGTISEAGKTFGDLCDRADDYGLKVGLEFIPSTNVATAADALRIVEAADRYNGGICVDIWHHQRGANDLELISLIPAEKVIDVQMSDGPIVPVSGDYNDDTRRNRVPPGEGEMDLHGFVAAIRATGTTAPWSLEVCNESSWDTNGMEFVARCASGLRQILSADR